MGVVVPEGYKDSPAGAIPIEWDAIAQGNVATFYNGRAYKLTEWEDTGTPVIRLQNLTGTGNEYYYSNLQLPEHQYVNHGDLLYMWSATIGPKIWRGDKAIYHYHIWKVVCNVQRLNQDFMLQSLIYLTEQMKGQSHGSTMLHITKSGMEKHLFALPPLSEQKKIARILSTVDSKLALIDQQITATQTLKKGLMQKLFSEGVGTQDANGQWQPHTDFKDSELGRIPAGWEIKSVSEITKWSSGGTPSKGNPNYWSGNIPWISAASMRGKYYSNSELKISELAAAHAAKMAEPNSLLLLVRGSMLWNKIPVGLTTRSVAFNQDVKCITPLVQFATAEFLFYWFSANEYHLMSMVTGTGIGAGKLETSELQSLEIKLPPKNEQEQIAKILTTVDCKLTQLTTQKTQTEQLKKGLMQKLLTGQIRVAV